MIIPNGGFEVKVKAAVFIFKKVKSGGCIKVTIFQGYGGIKGGIAVSIFILRRTYKFYPLKKVHIPQRNIIAHNMNTHII